MKTLYEPESGVHGELVASRNHYGQHLREKGHPKKRLAVARAEANAAMRMVAEAWNNLTDERIEEYKRNTSGIRAEYERNTSGTQAEHKRPSRQPQARYAPYLLQPCRDPARILPFPEGRGEGAWMHLNPTTMGSPATRVGRVTPCAPPSTT